MDVVKNTQQNFYEHETLPSPNPESPIYSSSKALSSAAQDLIPQLTGVTQVEAVQNRLTLDFQHKAPTVTHVPL